MFTKEYIQAVTRKLEKRGLSEEEIKKELNLIMGVTKAEVKEPEVTVRFCEFCLSKGVRHLKTCNRPQ